MGDTAVAGMVLRGVTLADGSLADVRLARHDDRIVGRRRRPPPARRRRPRRPRPADRGRRAAHPPRQGVPGRAPRQPAGDLGGAIETMIAARPHLTVDGDDRAGRARGPPVRPPRLHARCAPTSTRRSTTACAASRRWSPCASRVADVIDVQIVAMCGWPVVGAEGGAAAGPAARRDGDRRRPRRWLPAPRPRRPGRRRRPTSSSPPSTASASTCTPTRRSTADVDGLSDLAALVVEHRVPAAGHGQPLRQPRHAGRGPPAGGRRGRRGRRASRSSPCRPRTSTCRAATTSRRCRGA